MQKHESGLGRLYRKAYDGLCGRLPNLRIWHFQWLAAIYLHRSLLIELPRLEGNLLDVGCGNKPYKRWAAHVNTYTGIDIYPGDEVDIVIAPDALWPLADDGFDVVLSSQVFEHAANLELTLGEVRRVLKPGGMAILSFPFLYNEHGAPGDFRRFTQHEACRLFADFDIIRLETQGGIGSTLGILSLNWIELTMNSHPLLRLAKGALLPVWLLVALVVNICGIVLDRFDHTGAFYNNILLVARRGAASPGARA